MSIQKNVAIGIGAFLVGLAGIGHLNGASAAYRRVHSAQCHPGTDDAGPDLFNGAWLSTTTKNRNIYCAAPSDSELPHSSTNTLNVHGYAPYANSAYTKACIHSHNSFDAFCGPSQYWGAAHAGVSGVSTAEWSANPYGMPYVYTFLPAGASMYGFFMST